MRQPGLVDVLPSLRRAVYVGLSGGSMVMAPNVGEEFVGWEPPVGGDEAPGMVDQLSRRGASYPWDVSGSS
jgi:dipeptidase E